MPGRRRLPRATPTEQGVSARAILAFLDAVERGGPELHSLMVVRRGAVVAEGWWGPYRRELPHELYSLSKSVTSTAVGFAQAEGLLTVDDLLLDHLGDLAPAHPDPRLARMRLRHLLTMTTGHTVEPDRQVFGSAEWARTFLALPIGAEPGTEFLYNTPASYVLSFLVQRLTGQRVLDYLRPRLLEPLGIEGAVWEQSPEGVDTGGFGLSLTTEDIACLGELYRTGGTWDGVQVLPEGWAATATARHTDSHITDPDWAQGYGYQFWRCQPPGLYRGDGAFGQFCVVMPEQQAVVATTSGTPDMQGVLDRMWTHLVPALAGDAPADVGADVELAARLAELRLPVPAGGAVPVDALAGRRVELEGTLIGVRAVRVGPEGLGAPGGSVVVELARGGEVTLPVGVGAWADGELPPRTREGDLRAVAGDGPAPVATAGAWTGPETFVAQVRHVATPYALTITARLASDGTVRARGELNVSFGERDLGEVTGRVAAVTP